MLTDEQDLYLKFKDNVHVYYVTGALYLFLCKNGKFSEEQLLTSSNARRQLISFSDFVIRIEDNMFIKQQRFQHAGFAATVAAKVSEQFDGSLEKYMDNYVFSL